MVNYNPLRVILVFFFLIFMTAYSQAAHMADMVKANTLIHPDGRGELLNHVPMLVARSSMLGHLDPQSPIHLLIPVTLPPAKEDALVAFIADVHNPKSRNYGNFLGQGQFAQIYSASPNDLNVVKKYLQSQGMQVNAVLNGSILDVTTTSGKAEVAFNVTLNKYQRPSDGLIYYSNQNNPTVDVNLVGRVGAIIGLNNIPVDHSPLNPIPAAAPSPINPSNGTNPNINPTGLVASQDIYTAYNLSNIPSDGTGQTVAIIDAYSGFNTNDLYTYEATHNLPHLTVGSQFQFEYENGSVPSVDSGWDEEETLDVETVRAFAPGSNIVLYEANSSSNVDLLSMIEKAATDDTAKVISNSWGETEFSFEGYYDSLLNLDQFAAQGQTIFFSSGDSGTVEWPSSSPYVTSVGVTNLTTNSNGTWKSESAWDSGWASGGGASVYEAIPSWQLTMAKQAAQGTNVSETDRNTPDIALAYGGSASAKIYFTNPSNKTGSWASVGGTSAACPMMASIISRVNEGRINAQLPPVGTSLNTMLYQLAQSSNYSTDFHDITTGKINSTYSAGVGYDAATGLGSMNGLNLYNDLVPSVYTITITDPNGSVAETVNGTSNSGPYSAGTVVTLTATPANGYQFSSWSGAASGTSNTTTVTVNSNLSVTANFTQIPSTYTLTVSAGSNGSISPSGTVKVNSGTSQTFIVTPNAGYTASLTVDGSAVTLSNNSYTLNNITANHTVAASFALQTETITASAGSGGSISPSGSVSVPYGGNQTFTVTALAGYTPTLTVDGSVVTLTNNSFTLSNVLTNHTVTASFALQNETITASAGTGGSISPSGAVSVPYGTNQTFTVTANSGYTPSLTVDGNAVTLTNNTYTLTNVIAAHTVAASFTLIPNTYTLTVTVSNGTATINPNRTAYTAGSVVTVTADCNSGYTFNAWTGDFPGKTNPAQITMTKNTNLNTICNVHQAPYLGLGDNPDFAPASFPATLTIVTPTVTDDGNVNPSNVTVTFAQASGPGALTLPASQTLAIIPNTAMPLLGNTIIAPAPGVYTITVTAKDEQLYGSKQEQLTVLGGTVSVKTNGSGTVSLNPPGGNYATGTVVTLTATANPGSSLTGWSNALPSSSNPSVATVTVNGSTTIVTANFAPLSVNAGPSQTLTAEFPTNVSLHGSAVGATSVAWSVDPSSSGPASAVTFANPASAVTTAQISQAGTYLLDLTAYNGSNSVVSQVTITVNAGFTLNVTPTGTVTKSPNMAVYPAGTSVTLTATAPNASSQFLSWSGDSVSTSNPLIVTVNNNMNINAVFNEAPVVSVGGSQTLDMPSNGNPVTVTLSGNVKNLNTTPSTVNTSWTEVSGTQAVINNPNQTLNVGANANASVPTTASLPSAGTYVFKLSASSGAMTSSATVTVTVNPTGTYTLTVNINKPAAGDVNVYPQPPYTAGTEVTVTAVPNAGYGFFSWSGGASGSDPSITVTITKNTILNANFNTDDTAPTAYAGPSQTIPWPSSGNATVTLNSIIGGSGIMPNALTATWKEISGRPVIFNPATTSTANTNNEPISTTVSFPAAGTYVLALTASDGLLSSPPSDVTITVTPPQTFDLNVTDNGCSVSLSPAPPAAGYTAGTVVKMTARPNEGTVFASWGGDAAGSTDINPTNFTINATSNNVIANCEQPTPAVVLPGVYDNSESVNTPVPLNGQVITALSSSSVNIKWSATGPGKITISGGSTTAATQAKTPYATTPTMTFSKAGTYVVDCTVTYEGLITSRTATVTVVAPS